MTARCLGFALLLVACGDDQATNSDAGATGPSSGAATTGVTEASPGTPTTGATDGDQPSCGEPPCAGTVTWAHAFLATPSNANNLGVSTIAQGPDGSIFVAGSIGGALVLGDLVVEGESSVDVWIARFDPQGEPQWARRFGSMAGNTSIVGGGVRRDGDIRIDSAGNVLFSAQCINTFDFGAGPIAGENFDPLLLKLSPDGEVLWGRRWTDMGDQNYKAPVFIAVDAVDRVWVAGTLGRSAIDLGGGPLKSAGYGDVLLALLDPDGNHLWSDRFGDPAHQTVEAIEVGSEGGIMIAGSFMGELDLGAGALVSAGNFDVFVASFWLGSTTWARRGFLARLDAGGAGLWSRDFLVGEIAGIEGTAIDPSGRIAAVGWAFPETSEGLDFHRWLRTWTADGEPLLATNFPVRGGGFPGGIGVALLPSGTAVVAFASDVALELDGHPLGANGQTHLVLAAIAP